ncbi:cohesin domain-containing protein [Methanococcoides burtonii]|uniref:Protein with cohesin domain n=1 Tax=Methanococcoides burtonii (strain DSM 6242 / NBRC 107633 / OCM 468 / ACE-M) TaxID=259564 RepID=Q12XY2_METBU|nr:cohesin domain-containing protein [Methanococcoides burtonii]ABE51694.1 Protein with cohesin domain [Methanococcoides burtonii DSM 6242]
MFSIRKVLSIVAIIALVVVLSNISAASTDVILNPSSQINEPGSAGTSSPGMAFTVSSGEVLNVAPGETFNVDVFVSPDVDIAGMQFDLLFDSSKFQIDSVTEGNLFKQSGMGTFFVAASVTPGLLDNTYGCILGNAAVLTPANFATITITANEHASGRSAFILKDVIVSDPKGNAVNVGILNTEVAILVFDISSEHVVEYNDFDRVQENSDVIPGSITVPGTVPGT